MEPNMSPLIQDLNMDSFPGLLGIADGLTHIAQNLKNDKAKNQQKDYGE
jgi:hypothetical protein